MLGVGPQIASPGPGHALNGGESRPGMVLGPQLRPWVAPGVRPALGLRDAGRAANPQIFFSYFLIVFAYLYPFLQHSSTNFSISIL